ncbi:MAG: 2-oxoacid:acceptor oxidoreductase family protein [Nanoarchaeota archaeon]
MIEIKIIGRGGQGGKSAAAIIAEAALKKDKFIQSFPEFGAERQGAPVFAYTRISDKEIKIHYSIKNPNIVAVLDPTLLDSIPIVDGIKENGILIVNTTLKPKDIRDKLGYKTGKVFTIDATKISVELFGRNIPNSPMLGAIEKACNLVGIDVLNEKIREKFERKIGVDITNKNIEAIKRAFDEVLEG